MLESSNFQNKINRHIKETKYKLSSFYGLLLIDIWNTLISWLTGDQQNL